MEKDAPAIGKADEAVSLSEHQRLDATRARSRLRFRLALELRGSVRRRRWGGASGMLRHVLPAGFRPSTVRMAATTEAAAARGLRPGFVHRKAPTADLAGVQVTDCGLCLLIAAHLDEREPTGTPRCLVTHHGDGFDRSGAREQLLQLRFTDLVRQIADL